MSSVEPAELSLPRPPKRADARRNHEKLLAAARDVFTEAGTSATLEEVARRAGVGIGTLYRHFPTRQDLLGAVFAGEVELMRRAADELDDREPWEALETWLRRYVGFAATKRALMDALMAIDAAAPGLQNCRQCLLDAGSRLLGRAQEAGVARPDVTFPDVGRMVSAIATMPTADEDQVDRVLRVALDGLRAAPGT